MFSNRLTHCLILTLLLLTGQAGVGYCLDEVKILPGSSGNDVRQTYPTAVLIKALEATRQTDGPFRVTLSRLRMTRSRALDELVSGRHINIYIAATRQEWEERAIPVRIPVFKGLSSYRLLLIDCGNLEKFKGIHSLEALKQLRGGSGQQWSMTQVFRRLDFNIVTGNSYEGLFSMLNAGRFDYFSRGINEIFPEMEHRAQDFPRMCIEPTLALYCPLPNYFFISPTCPKLADRIRRGMETMIANGELDALFRQYFNEDLVRSELKKRTILKMDNPLLSKETLLDRPGLWFTP